MAFYELQREEILAGTLLFYLLFHEQMSMGWTRSPDTADDLHSWQYGIR